MSRFEQNRNAHLHVITRADILPGPYATTNDVIAAMLANEIPGVTKFGYDHQLDVQLRGKGQFGLNKPIGMTDEYNGIKGSLDVEGVDGEKAIEAMLNGIARANFISGNYSKLREFFIICNSTADDGAPLKAHICGPCKIDGVPKEISGDAKRFSFQGIFAKDFTEKRIRFHVVQGNDATPVTAVNYPTGETPVAWKDENDVDRYALLVLRTGSDGYTKRLIVGAAASAGVFTETGSGITLASADQLGTGDYILVAYAV